MKTEKELKEEILKELEITEDFEFKSKQHKKVFNFLFSLVYEKILQERNAEVKQAIKKCEICPSCDTLAKQKCIQPLKLLKELGLDAKEDKKKDSEISLDKIEVAKRMDKVVQFAELDKKRWIGLVREFKKCLQDKSSPEELQKFRKDSGGEQE